MSETLNNIAKAFIGESVAAVKYTLFAEIADKDGLIEAKNLFIKTAEQEKIHAKIHFRLLSELCAKRNTSILKVAVQLPVELGDTLKNIELALNGEVYEFKTMYPDFAEKAKKEGYEEIAERFQALARAEEGHAEKYNSLMKKIKTLK
ncbi:MAG: rubrerythrin family protein [Candidatus Odinarchaeum yellowstonii]|uniref:Rubrerythrin family protein n=1 Tax=Odinarchaeota yellowstonii (strain LCB_4) TaxID=1841599 RepID=A0AAF0D1C4_ODILC|nr:MAG: rubrerythrin family protein [Candidatus Odinarchaeum yellowstonii]